MELLEKLENIKQKGVYAIHISFGEGIGADDSDVPMMDRSLNLTFFPAGYLGSLRAIYKGDVKDFLDFDFTQEPKVISNPPKEEELKDFGFYVWGSESSIEIYNETQKLFIF